MGTRLIKGWVPTSHMAEKDLKMDESFVIAINAVIPFLCYLMLGYFARRIGVVDIPFLNKLTKLIFAVMFPFMTFNNIYSASRGNVPSVTLLVFVGVSILVLEGFLLLLLVPRLVPENPRRGVIIQAMYRSNFVLFGLPLTTTLYGPEKTAIAAMLVTVVLTIYNITSVIILELFNDADGKIMAKSLLIKLVKNPMLQGCCIGLVFYAFQIKLPTCLASPISSFANMTTPLAMFALGGTLQFGAIRKNRKYLIPTLLGKLLAVPLVLVFLAYMIGLRGVELFLVVAVFGTPVASGSYPMAMNMGGDGELAGQLVFTSTVVAVVTLFLWIFCMNHIGLL